jgi:hypothetical protein
MKLQRCEWGDYESITEVDIDEKMLDFVVTGLEEDCPDFHEYYCFTLEDLEKIAAGETTRWEEIYFSGESSSIHDLAFDLMYSYLNENGKTEMIDQSTSDWEMRVLE